MAQMTLTLTLKGVSNLITSLKTLNKELGLLDRRLDSTANKFLNASNRLALAVQNIKVPSRIPSLRPASGGSGGSGGSNQQNSNRGGFNMLPSDWNLLSAAISGDMKQILVTIGKQVLGSKVLPTIAKNLAKPQSGIGPPVPPSMAAAALAAVTNPITLSVLGLSAIFTGLKLSVDKWTEVAKSQISLYYGAGANSSFAGLKKLGAALNISPEEIGADASRTPGKGKVLKNLLKQLNAMDEEASVYFAEKFGLEKYLNAGIRSMSKKDLDKILDDEGKINPEVIKKTLEFNSAMGDLSNTFNSALLELTPLITLFTGLIQLGKDLAYNPLFKWVMDQYQNRPKGGFAGSDAFGNKDADNGQAKAAKDIRDAAKDFKSGVDKWTKKEGTIGGGNRGKNPFPRGMVWMSNQEYLIQMQENLGAFEF